MIRQPSYDPMKNYGAGGGVPTPNQFPSMPRSIMGLNTQQFIDNILPAGIILPYGGAIETIPSGWLLCNGQTISRQSYARLFTAIGISYGAGDGSTFSVPDMRGRVPAGYDAGQAEFDALGETGGAKTHNHTIPNHTYADFTAGGVFNTIPAANHATGSDSSSSLSPYLTLNYIVKA